MLSHGQSKVMIYLLLNRVVDIKIETTFKHPSLGLFPFLSYTV